MNNILHFVSYIAIPTKKKFSTNLSGYGYLVHDIATNLAKNSEVSISVMTQSSITNEFNYKGVKILKRTWSDILLNLNVYHLLNALSVILKRKIPIKKLPNIILYFISMGYCKKVIQEGKFELIHIHGISYYTIPLIELCEKHNFKYMVTLHGLNSFYKDPNAKISWNEKKYIKHFYENNIPVTVISEGVRKKIMEFLYLKNATNFKVINAGYEKSQSEDFIDIRKKYSIPNDCKIMLCIGGISDRKNQKQALASFDKIDHKIKEKLYILFLGYDTTGGEFESKISHKNLIYCGFIPKSRIGSYYQQSDFNLIISKHEGFGLSSIEGFNSGLPLLTYADLEVVDDIFDKNAVLLINDRSDEALAKGIVKIYRKKWDKDTIIKHSQKFTINKMTEHYIEHYKQLKDD